MKKIITVILALLVFSQLYGQEVDSLQQAAMQNSKFEPVTDTVYTGKLFEGDTPIDITLISDFTSFVKPNNDDKYMPAKLIVHLPNNDSIVKNIRIKTRGKQRKEMCNFPPIKLNFKTDPIKNPDYEGINKMKMVTFCKESKIFNDYILKEYLIYRIYNLITDYSFKVRLLKIDYEDTGKKGMNTSKFGFVIEPLKALAKRLNAVEVESKAIPYSQLDPLSADRVALFNYMIGNTDWYYKSSHNIKFIKVLDLNVTGAYVIPYDFDFSGFVNTHYAMPQEWSMSETIQERDYMGFCRPTDTNFEILKKEFLNAEQKIYDLIENFEYLPKSEKKRLKWYMEEFYKELKSKNAYKIITSNCRKPY